METIQLNSYHDVGNWAGEYPQPHWIDRIVAPNTLVLKPDGSPLLLVVPGAISKQFYQDTYEAVAPLARSSPRSNRGTAAGKIGDQESFAVMKSGMRIGGTLGQRTATRYRPIKNDGRMSKTVYAKMTPSFVMGYSDRSSRFPYCRQTKYTNEHPERTAQILPMLQYLTSLFHEVLPQRYEAQASVAAQTHPAWLFPGTVFTTITVNRNWQTALHKDVGDLGEGFGIMLCLRAGKYQGGIYVMPSYGIGVDLQAGDVLFSDVHEWHGNTPIEPQGTYERITLVCYYRTKMRECGTPEDELLRVKRYGVRRLHDEL